MRIPMQLFCKFGILTIKIKRQINKKKFGRQRNKTKIIFNIFLILYPIYFSLFVRFFVSVYSNCQKEYGFSYFTYV